MSSGEDHFVYVYRDARGNPVYFGQGKRLTRAAVHKTKSHHVAFGEWLGKHKHTVEVIGPLGSKEAADAIETALISACMPSQAMQRVFFNNHPGRSAYRFRPFGVPQRYVERTTQTLKPAELRRLCREGGPIMFVRVNQKTFIDERPGYDLAAPPADAGLRSRMECWWQVAHRRDGWANRPETSPSLLVAVTGGPGAQFIIASATIDRKKWSKAESLDGGLLKIPLKRGTLDARKLRGRPIDVDVGLRFNAFRHSQYRILTKSGFVHEAEAKSRKK